MVKIMLDKQEAYKLKRIPLSHNLKKFTNVYKSHANHSNISHGSAAEPTPTEPRNRGGSDSGTLQAAIEMSKERGAGQQ